MANYQFCKNGEAIKLAEVDDKICEAFGITSNPDRFSGMFNQAVEVGFSILYEGGSFVTKELVDNWFDSRPGRAALRSDPEVLKMMEFLDGTHYTFDAWR
jgi:hypothetical protein